MNRLLLASTIFAVACGGSTGPKGGSALGIAVINGDYKSTAVSLIDPKTGTLAQDDCIDSGAVTPTLSMALSGDVVLATAPQPSDQLLLLDRTNSAIDWITPSTCKVVRQASVGTGFYANPHDAVGISATKIYVTRFETNSKPSGAAANDGGNDVLILDPSSGAILGRIDMTSYAASASVQSRPDRALLANGKVYVTLANTSGDFKTVGTGRVVAIDPTSDKVTGTIDLAPYKSCSGLDYSDATKTLIVGCGGDYNAALADQTAQSALVLVDIGGATPTVKKAIGGQTLGGRPVSSVSFAVAGDNLAIVGTYGDASNTPPDGLWAITLEAGTATKILDADGGFVIGGVTWDPAAQKVYVTDAGATKPVVRVFDVSKPGAVRQASSFDANPKSGLPPRQIGWY
jgi:hypothetical protein